MQRISDKGLALIKSFEGLYLKAYKDVVGVWTIGWGCTEGVKRGMRITRKQAEEMLRAELAKHEKCVNKYTTVPLTQGQFDALVSFSYNLGCGAFRKSTLRRKLNRGDYEGAAEQFIRWVHAGGRVYKGLVRRRRAETALFMDDESTPKVNTATKKEKLPKSDNPQPVNKSPAKQLIKHSTTFRAAVAQVLLAFAGAAGIVLDVATDPRFLAGIGIGVVVAAMFIIYRRYQDIREG